MAWKYQINLKAVWAGHRWRSSFEQTRNDAVAILRGSFWYTDLGAHPRVGMSTLDELITQLENAQSISQFDYVFRDITDLADIDRVWIETS